MTDVTGLIPALEAPHYIGGVVTDCYDVSRFHPQCPNISVIAGPTNLYLYCSDCRIVAHVDQVCRGILPGDVACMSKKEVQS